MTDQSNTASSAGPTTPEHGTDTRKGLPEKVIALSCVAGEKRTEGLTVARLQPMARREDAVFPAPPRSSIARRDNTRRYSIEIKDVATEKSVYALAADWTEYEKRSAIARIVRLAGLADERR